MRFISEEQSAALVTHELAFEAARQAFVAAVREDATSFPAVLGHGSSPANRFSIKAGATADCAGLKIGSFWPGNLDRDLPRHNSLVLLFDQDRGRIDTVLEAGRVNAFRTAAADSVAASVLARPDAGTLTVFGAGNQAEFECRALTRILPIRRILVVGRETTKAEALAERLCADGLHAEVSSPREGCEAADVVVTATSARAPLFDDAWIRPGTHVASMGSDAKGKQELPVSLLERASLFCDLPAQSVVIGEFQHVADRIEAGELTLRAIGEVLASGRAGRISTDEITVFDSSGIALQDLIMAGAIVDAAIRATISSANQEPV